MIKFQFFCRSIAGKHVKVLIEEVLQYLTCYIVPIAILLLSAIAMFWPDEFDDRGSRTLDFGLVVDRGLAHTLDSAITHLADAPRVSTHRTKLSEEPHWIHMRIPDGFSYPVIELPSRHANTIECWDAVTRVSLGLATRSTVTGAMHSTKAGFSIDLENTSGEVICKVKSIGPAHITAIAWPHGALDASISKFERRSGLLEGGMMVMALAVLVTAAVTRRVQYVILAGWLVLNLRLGAMSAGTDWHWLGYVIPADWLYLVRSITVSLFGIVTMVMCEELLGDHLRGMRYQFARRIVQWLCFPMLIAAVFVPYRIYLMLLWTVLGTCFSLMAVGPIRLAFVSRTRSVVLFSISFAITFLASTSEAIAAALGVPALSDLLSNVVSAIISGFLAALAVSEHMRGETMQRIRVQRKLEQTYEAVPVGMFTLNMEGIFISANPAVDALLPTPIKLSMSRWRDIFSSEESGLPFGLSETNRKVEIECTHLVTGRQFLVRAALANGCIEGALEDITEKRQATERLRFLANNDPLTGVLNRRGITEAYRRACAPGETLCLASFDLDRFRLINELFGHSVGDAVLALVCQRMQVQLGQKHSFGRIGGDEFVLIMPSTSLLIARLMCANIIEQIGSTPYRVSDQAFHVRSSVGLIEVPPSMEIRAAMDRADFACRQAKRSAIGMVTLRADDLLLLHDVGETDLITLLARPDVVNRLGVEAQPILPLGVPGDSFNFEAILRIGGNNELPVGHELLRVAVEKSGNSTMVDLWLVNTTLKWIGSNMESLQATKFVSVRVANASIANAQFSVDLALLLQQQPAAAKKLCIDISESALLQDPDGVHAVASVLRTSGGKIALDDFGAAATSWLQLEALMPDLLKIDASLAAAAHSSAAGRAVMQAIVTLARNLGIRTLAYSDGSASALRALAEVDVNYVQGDRIAAACDISCVVNGYPARDYTSDPDVRVALSDLMQTRALPVAAA